MKSADEVSKLSTSTLHQPSLGQALLLRQDKTRKRIIPNEIWAGRLFVLCREIALEVNCPRTSRSIVKVKCHVGRLRRDRINYQ